MKTLIGLLVVAALVSAHPKVEGKTPVNSFWKDTKVDGIVQSLRTECTDRNDALSCMKYKVLHFLDQVLTLDSVQLSENLEIVKNGAEETRTSRSEKPEMDILDHLTNYIKSHDVVATLPGSYFEGTTLTMSPRNLDSDEVTLSVKFSEDTKREGKAVQEEQEEGRKAKLKKIVVPLMVFLLLKAMTLVPMALGILGIKAWNALQLSFFSFVVSLALAVFQLCKKLASDHGSGPVSPHGPWDNYQAAHYAARSFPEATASAAAAAQSMAYSAHSQS